jgi:hypothetical protein
MTTSTIGHTFAGTGPGAHELGTTGTARQWRQVKANLAHRSNQLAARAHWTAT